MKEYKAGPAKALVYTCGEQNKPLVLFRCGMGERDNGRLNIMSGVSKHGPMHFIAQGWKPDFNIAAFFDFYAFPGADRQDACITGLLESLEADGVQIDRTQVYYTGLSAGAKSVLMYVLSKASYAAKIAGIVVMSSPSVNTAYKNNPQRLNAMPCWAFHGRKDAQPGCHLEYIKPMYDSVKKANPKHFFLTLGDYGHCCWNTRFAPTYKGPLSKLNVYEFLFKNKKQAQA